MSTTTTRAAAERKISELRARADELDGRASAPTGELAPWRGSPILVGHSSEKAHRRTMARAAKVWDRQAADTKEAERLRREANALEAKVGREVFDTDGDAAVKLAAEIAGMERVVEKLKGGAIPSMGPLERKDQVAGVRRQIRAKRKRLDALTGGQEQRNG